MSDREPFTGKPRDPDRIPKVLSALAHLWMENPDLRLGQIMGNASISYYTEDNKALGELEKWREHFQDRKSGTR